MRVGRRQRRNRAETTDFENRTKPPDSTDPSPRMSRGHRLGFDQGFSPIGALARRALPPAYQVERRMMKAEIKALT
jgi:hypothetical protein